MTHEQAEPRPAGTGAAQGLLGFGETTGPGPEGQEAAELGKLRALAVLSARHAGRVRNAQRAMVALLLARPDDAAVSIDDVRAQLGELPDRRPTWLGAVPHGLRIAGLIEHAGFVQSDRVASHCRPVSLWRLRDRDAAAVWLADHE